MKKIVQILGPTGIGKSKIAVFLAKKISGEIISADSMQVYKGFDIGTDKINQKEREGIVHYLIDILEDCSQFNASKFLNLSFEISEDMIIRKKIPIVCGGTALYLRTMIRGIFPEKKEKRISRHHLNEIVETRGLLFLWQKLKKIDPNYADKIGSNDRIRIIRALEIFYNNHMTASEIFKKTVTPFREYQFIRVGLIIDRKLLYENINKRVDDMFERGLIDEVKGLKEKFPLDCPPFKSLGYKEILMYLDKQIDLEKAKEMIKLRSRNFSKRQLSWFRQEKDIKWFSPCDMAKIEKYLKNALWKNQ